MKRSATPNGRQLLLEWVGRVRWTDLPAPVRDHVVVALRAMLRRAERGPAGTRSAGNE